MLQMYSYMSRACHPDYNKYQPSWKSVFLRSSANPCLRCPVSSKFLVWQKSQESLIFQHYTNYLKMTATMSSSVLNGDILDVVLAPTALNKHHPTCFEKIIEEPLATGQGLLNVQT